MKIFTADPIGSCPIYDHTCPKIVQTTRLECANLAMMTSSRISLIKKSWVKCQTGGLFFLKLKSDVVDATVFRVPTLAGYFYTNITQQQKTRPKI